MLLGLVSPPGLSPKPSTGILSSQLCSVHTDQSSRWLELSVKGGVPDVGIDKQSSNCASRGCSHHSFRNRTRRIKCQTFTSTKYPNLKKQSNGQKIANTWKINEINDSSAYIHTHTKGNCSHIHPQYLQ